VSIPLFPLHSVLFPGGPLPLRIFEPRYLDMVSRCLKNDESFGVLLIREGSETGAAAVHEVGTMARIVDWYQGSDGLLGITALGQGRFRLLSSRLEPDGLNVGEIEMLRPVASMKLPAEYQPLAPILEGILSDLGLLYESLEKHYDDAYWVACRFLEVLPVEAGQKQQLLESDDVPGMLRLISEMLQRVRR